MITSDVQSEKNKLLEPLDWVGMGHLQSAILLNNIQVPCSLNFVVNLIEGHRGIHMSRLYSLMIEQFLKKELSFENLKSLLTEAVLSQENLSNQAGLQLNFQFPVSTLALKSEKIGFRNYPVQISAQLDSEKNFKAWISFEVLYSSTCPQSAALAVEVLNQSKNLFSTWLERLPATPHAQRSVMTCEILVNAYDQLLFNALNEFISDVERSLKTPVQTAVKKADEMAFAVLNSENLMFCEDAVRNVAQLLKMQILKNPQIVGFKVKTRHEESLHPHNAISQTSFKFQNSPF